MMPTPHALKIAATAATATVRLLGRHMPRTGVHGHQEAAQPSPEIPVESAELPPRDRRELAAHLHGRLLPTLDPGIVAADLVAIVRDHGWRPIPRPPAVTGDGRPPTASGTARTHSTKPRESPMPDPTPRPDVPDEPVTQTHVVNVWDLIEDPDVPGEVIQRLFARQSAVKNGVTAPDVPDADLPYLAHHARLRLAHRPTEGDQP